MAKPLVSDELWAVAAPLMPAPRPKKKAGRPRVPDRACLTGIVFVLKTGIQWEYLPQEMGCGSGMTCWRRLRAWQRAGVWQRLHRVLLQRLADAGRIDWSRASADAARVWRVDRVVVKHRRSGRRRPRTGAAAPAERGSSNRAFRAPSRWRTLAPSRHRPSRDP